MSAAADSNPPGELYCTACEKTFHVGERCPVDGNRLLKLKARIDPFLGRDLDGRYTVLEKLGQGGMGAVYRAEQHSVGREVAVKVVNSNLISEPDVIKRFLREAKLASKLAHPNAVAVLDFNQTDDGVFYLVMELVTGRTLDQVLKADSVFRPERVVRIGTQVLDALDGAHALSIIHRDLKPSNIILLSQGRDLVKVLDFGLAKSVSPDATSTTMTGVGAVVGTPAFMPPELATGMPCDGRADLYSLGVILYLMGSGRLPFMSDSVHELLAMHGSDEAAPPMTGVPHRLARVIDKLLMKDPDERFQTAAEALQALETALVLTTPVPESGDSRAETHPSIGPFPASTAQFRHLETPIPPSAILDKATKGERRKPSSTEVQRLMSGETMLASEGAPATATSQPGASLPGLAPAKKRWPLVALVGAAVATAAITFVVVAGGSSDPPTPPAKSAPITAPPVDETPVVGKPDDPPPITNLAAGSGSGSAATSVTEAGSGATSTTTATTRPKPTATRPKPSTTKPKPKPTTTTTTTTTTPPTKPPPGNGSGKSIATPF